MNCSMVILLDPKAVGILTDVSLADRVLMVVGATGGLGRVVAGLAAAAGARMILVGTDRGRLGAVAGEHGLVDGRWLPFVADAANAVDARAVVAAGTEAFGRVDALLHMVGGWVGGTAVSDLDSADVQAMLDGHLWSTFHLVQAVLPGMLERGHGRIVAVSSPYAGEPGARGAPYAIGKAAQDVLLRSLAREVANTGVTVNQVSVRTIDVGHEREREPTPRNAAWATPEEIAAVMLFLASDEAAAVNGARIPLFGRG